MVRREFSMAYQLLDFRSAVTAGLSGLANTKLPSWEGMKSAADPLDQYCSACPPVVRSFILKRTNKGALSAL